MVLQNQLQVAQQRVFLAKDSFLKLRVTSNLTSVSIVSKILNWQSDSQFPIRFSIRNQILNLQSDSKFAIVETLFLETEKVTRKLSLNYLRLFNNARIQVLIQLRRAGSGTFSNFLGHYRTLENRAFFPDMTSVLLIQPV